MTHSLKIDLPELSQSQTDIQKTFFESLPYFMGARYEVIVEQTGLSIRDVPASKSVEVSNAVKEAFLKAKADFTRVTENVLHSHEGQFHLKQDVFESLLSGGGVHPTGEGKFVYAGEFAEVFAALDQFLLDLCLKNGASKEFYPTALQSSSLLRCGYFNTFAQHAFFMSPLDTSLQAINAAKSGSLFEEPSSVDMNTTLQMPEWTHSPTVCHHSFESRMDSTIELPLKITAINQCARYEVHGTRTLERLRLYWMREFVHFDHDPKAVAQTLDTFVELMIDLLSRWGLSFKVASASDPFFSGSGTSKRMFQNTFLLKRELLLPINNKKSIACASFNNHQCSLTDAFEISQASSDKVSSGCVAWGYDRFLFALYTQLGTNVTDWPKLTRTDLQL